MKTITNQWLEFARADLDAAKVQFQHGPRQGSAYQITVFHCHQAIEKILKAYLIENDIPLHKTHDLTYLRSASRIKFPSKWIFFIDTLNPHYLYPRYPDLPFRPSFTFTYNRQNVLSILGKTEKLYLWLEKKITPQKK